MEAESGSNMIKPERTVNGLVLTPVNPEDTGEGLPYAPVDWPNPGDVWSWKVGKRAAMHGHFVDRYLSLPKTIAKGKHTFASKLSVTQYIRSEYPNADIDAFFASFSWRVPASAKTRLSNGKAATPRLTTLSSEAKHSESECPDPIVGCKAGNSICSSLTEPTKNSSLAGMPCDLCCAEPRFCRDCCCILCTNTVTSDNRGYSYVKCDAMLSDGHICGHLAHINCALRSYLAGTVGGTIGLDAEYYCRRCDTRKDLIPHVRSFLKYFEDADSQEELGKILNTGLCIVRGSRRIGAIELLNCIELAIAKLKYGSVPGLTQAEDDNMAISKGISDNGNETLETIDQQDCVEDMGSPLQLVTESSDYLKESIKMEQEIDIVLNHMRQSQKLEYRIAEDQLYAQKNYLRSIYQQLDKEIIETTPNGSLPIGVLNRLDQANQEITKLKEMEQVAKGFGRTSKRTLKRHFGIKTDS